MNLIKNVHKTIKNENFLNDIHGYIKYSFLKMKNQEVTKKMGNEKDYLQIQYFNNKCSIEFIEKKDILKEPMFVPLQSKQQEYYGTDSGTNINIFNAVVYPVIKKNDTDNEKRLKKMEINKYSFFPDYEDVYNLLLSFVTNYERYLQNLEYNNYQQPDFLQTPIITIIFGLNYYCIMTINEDLKKFIDVTFDQRMEVENEDALNQINKVLSDTFTNIVENSEDILNIITESDFNIRTDKEAIQQFYKNLNIYGGIDLDYFEY